VAALTSKRWLVLPLIALLLAVWQGALLHPLKHRDQGGRLVHLAAVHSTDPGSQGSTGNASDKLCDALAALGACAGAAGSAPLAGAGAEAPGFRLRPAPRAPEARPYSAQAPPSLF
jgi:hypothetical protein